MTANRLYASVFPVPSCPVLKPVATDAQHDATFAGYITCLHKAWEPVLKSIGKQLPKPSLIYHAKVVNTPCGQLDPRFPAAYCSANASIYVSQASRDFGKKYKWSIADTAIHEFVHHVQWESGILMAAHAEPIEYLETSRRIELQTICMTSRQLITTPGVQFSKDDYDHAVYNFSVVGEEVHGSNESLTYWGIRGYYMSKIGGCNTWTVPPERVK